MLEERLSVSDADLLGSASPGVLLAMGASALVGLGASDMATAQFVRPRGGELLLVSHVGFGRDFAEHFAVVKGHTTVCGRALDVGEVVVVEDVANDPAFSGTVSREVMLAAGSAACASFPVLDARDQLVGVVSAHWRRPGTVDLSPAECVVGKVQELMATVVASDDDGDPALQAAGLRAALTSRDAIGVAKGILMAESKLSEDEAFAALARASQRENVRLRDIAGRIVEVNNRRAAERGGPTPNPATDRGGTVRARQVQDGAGRSGAHRTPRAPRQR